MKYQAPYGVTDTNAPYVNGNPQLGVQGSIPPAASIEFPQREIVNLINFSKITPDDSDLAQLTKGTRSQAMNFADDTGGVNALVAAFLPAITAYTRGLPLRIRVLNDNLVDATHTTMTLDAGAGAAPIRKMDGSSPANADIRAGAVIEVTWDGTAWQLTNFGGAGGGGTINYVNINIPYVVDTGTVNNIVGPFSPAITVLNVGAVLLVKVANSVTDITTLKVNALPPRPVKAPDGSDLLPGDIVAGDVVEFNYDGTNFYVRPNPSINVSTTITVNPTGRFPSVAAVMTAIGRKTIAPTAILTIQLPTGIFAPFEVYHKDADQIVVKGTMITSPPVYGNFSVTGASAAAKAADSANNIVMLRSRYGTEVQVAQSNIGNAAPHHAAGVWNGGPGSPTFQDLLITGDNHPPYTGSIWAPTGLGNYRIAGVFGGYGHNAILKNIATWGCTCGILAVAATFNIDGTCFACGHWSSGLEGDNGARIHISQSVMCLGNTGVGVWAAGLSSIAVIAPIGGVPQSYAQCNDFGCAASFSYIDFSGASILGNANTDAICNYNAVIVVTLASVGSVSPAGNVWGVGGHMVSAGGYPATPV